MTIISECFKHKIPLFDRLIPYGFTKVGETYHYRESFMAGNFEAVIEITSSGQVSASVYDKDFGEPYLPIEQHHQQGAYLAEVRQAYLAVLDALSEACFKVLPFESRQANHLTQRIAHEWGDCLETALDQNGHAVYELSGKSYAVIRSLPVEQLGEVATELRGKTIDVITLRASPQQLPKLLATNGIYPAYQMPKKSWVSVALTGELADDSLWDLLVSSRQMTQNTSLANPNGPDYWVIPANLAYYDIDAEFAANQEILWTQKASVRPGDYVFIYITAPIKSVRYACQVLETDIPNQGYRENPTIDRLMSLRLLAQYPDGLFSLDVLSSHGVKAVRGPRRLTPQLIAFLKKQHFLRSSAVSND